MTKKPESPVVFHVPISEELRDRLAYFMGDEIASDPHFWLTVLKTGIDKMESDLEEISSGRGLEPEEEGGTA